MGISTLPVTRSTAKVWKIWSNGPSYNTLTGNRTDEYIGNPNTRVYYLGGFYIFGTDLGSIGYSTDAKTWNYQIVFPVGTNINAIAYNGTTWVVAGQNNYCYTATTLGGTWTARTSQIGGTQRINDVTWVGGSINLFILTGNNNGTGTNVITTSPDGITWTGRVTASASGESYFAISVNTAQNYIMTCHDAGIASNQGRFSTNGTSWSTVVVTTSATPMYASNEYLPHVDRFVVWYFVARRAAASMGTNWTTTPGKEEQAVPTYWIGATGTSTSASNYQKRRLQWDSANSVYYAIDAGSGNFSPANLITFGNQDVLLYYTTSTANLANYGMNVISVEPIPNQTKSFNTSGGISPSAIPSLGYGNGIWVAAYSDYNGRNPVIYSTAT